MNVRLINAVPVFTVTKGDGRRRKNKRGVRKGRHMVRTRVTRGSTRARWAVVNDDGRLVSTVPRSFRTRKDAERALLRFEKAYRAHPSVRAFMI